MDFDIHMELELSPEEDPAPPGQDRLRGEGDPDADGPVRQRIRQKGPYPHSVNLLKSSTTSTPSPRSPRRKAHTQRPEPNLWSKRRQDETIGWKPKARIVVGGHLDPDEHDMKTDAPTSSASLQSYNW